MRLLFSVLVLVPLLTGFLPTVATAIDDREATVMFSSDAAVPSGNGTTFRDFRKFDYTDGGLAVGATLSVTDFSTQPFSGVYRVDPTTGVASRAADNIQVQVGANPSVQLAGFDGTNVWIEARGRNASNQTVQQLYKQTGTGGPVSFASPGSPGLLASFLFNETGKNADAGEISYAFNPNGFSSAAVQLNASGSGNVTLVPLNTPSGVGPNITGMPQAVVREGNDSVFLAFVNNTASGGFGYFKHDRSTGMISPIVTTSTPLPDGFGSTSIVSDFLGGLNFGNNFDYSNGSISFIADLAIGGRFCSPVFSNQSGTWNRIYEPGDKAPGSAVGATLAGADLVAKDGDTTYIMSALNVFQYSAGVLTRLFSPGDTLNNGAIRTVGYGQNWSILNMHAEDGMLMLNVRDNAGVDHIVGIHEQNPFSDSVNAGTDQMAEVIGGANRPGGVSSLFDLIDVGGDFTASFATLSTSEFVQQVTGLGGDPDSFASAGGDIQAWELDFSGDFTGKASLTFGYDDAGLSIDESQLSIYHLLADGSFEQLFGIVDSVNNTITVDTMSFSPFYLGQAVVVPEPGCAFLWTIGLITLSRRRRLILG